jgi:hypothetical protein
MFSSFSGKVKRGVPHSVNSMTLVVLNCFYVEAFCSKILNKTDMRCRKDYFLKNQHSVSMCLQV